MDRVEDGEKAALPLFLEARRAGVPAIADGLDEEALTTAVPPPGWTPLGPVDHLGHAGRHWFQEVLTGSAAPLPGRGENTPPRTTRPPSEVLAFRDQRGRSNAAPTATPLSPRPVGGHPSPLGEEITAVRRIAPRAVKETARHAGHPDAVREPLDERTGPRPR
ncbi:DUF664 domain-containing protein [Umezawaea sp.]|uniref:mycothiol transferase n=1 Tax=Umezawaea sp. TaxID=1955258 RepID=UPI002ED690E4